MSFKHYILFGVITSSLCLAADKEATEVKTYQRLEIIESLLGQEDFSSDWDELQKDIFYMDVKLRDLETLREKYPNVPSEKFQELKDKIGEF